MKSRKILIIVFTLILLAALALIAYDSHQQAQQKTINAIKPIAVQTVQTKLENWPMLYHTTGTLRTDKGLMITSPLGQSGIITKILFKSGQLVTKGQVLFYINPGDSVIIRAPFSGRVGLRKVNLGDTVTAGTPLVPLQNIDTVKITFSVPQKFLAKLKVGKKVNIKVSAYPRSNFQGKVTSINTVLDESTRSLRVWAEIPNPKHQLIPGMFANVQLVLDKSRQIIVVPQTAIVYDQAGNYVWRVVNDKATQTYVKLGHLKGEYIAIESGLQENQTIISVGVTKVLDGSVVTTVDKAS